MKGIGISFDKNVLHDKHENRAQLDPKELGTDNKDTESSCQFTGTTVPKNEVCHICDKTFTSIIALKEHIVYHIGKEPFDSKNYESCEGTEKLNKHRAPSLEKEAFLCEFCGKYFQSSLSLLQHSKIHSFKEGNQTWNARLKECEEKDEKAVLKDMQTCSNNQQEKIFICQTCSKIFLDQKKLKNHERYHQKPYKCDECGVTFSFPDSLKEHKFIHAGERPYLCHLCGRSFTQSSTLNGHIRMFHNRVKRFVCQFCSKQFFNRTGLRRHEVIHTGIKEYVCQFCEKRFAGKPDLKQHLKSHSDERPHACPHCEKRFSEHRYLVHHIRTHTGEKPFQCRFCEKRCSQKHNLKIHERIYLKEKLIQD